MPKMMRMPTVRQGLHRFDNVPSIRGPRSVFNLSHPHKTTFDAGLLIPVLVKEVLPGDTWAVQLSGFGRLSSSALQKPIMDNLYWDTWFFYCPMRLLWTNAPKFFGEQLNPGDSISFLIPGIATPWTPGANSIFDYMGVMPGSGAPGTVPIEAPNSINALPFRMYNLMYNQWFRDQNLISSAVVALTDGGEGSGNYVLRKRAKRPDYFTSALPFLQKGVAVTSAVVPAGTGIAGAPTFVDTTTLTNVGALKRLGAGADTTVVHPPAGTAGAFLAWSDPKLTVLINDLRQAVMIQEFLERDARGGTRYPELVYEHFGVENPDARVQRVEYLGGGSSQIVVNPVANTSNTSTGNLAGTGSVFVKNHGFHKSFTEHGYLMCIVNVRADVTYYQGIEKQWTRSTRFDFYWREFAHLGEQAILNREIYWQATTAANGTDIAVFGYQARYEEYRFAFGRISGAFRGTLAAPLDMWHLAQEFGALPTLGQTFIEDATNAVVDRVLAVGTEPDIIADLWFDIKRAAPIPVYGIPGFARRF